MNTSELIQDTEEFVLDSEINFREFLKINSKMKPATSTQITHQCNSNRSSSSAAITPTTKFVYHPYNKNNTLNVNQDNNIKENTAPLHLSGQNYTTTTSQSSLIPNNQFEERVLLIMKDTLREVKLLRAEFKEFKEKCSCQETTNDEGILLQIPANSIEAFDMLERNIKTDNRTEIYLKKHYQTISDPSMEKYVRCCLKSVITDGSASHFSYTGQHGNISIKSYFIIKLLKDAALKKFNSRVVDIETTIKKWFQYAKDRKRTKHKKMASKHQLSESK